MASSQPPDFASPSSQLPADAQGQSSKLNVPLSEQNASSSTGLSGATASDPAESIGRGSKRSLAERRRAGSTASSKRSQNATAATNEKTTRPVSSGATAQAEQPRTRKKKGFLAFLNCCSPPEESNEVGQQESAKVVSQSARVQPTTAAPPQSQKGQAAGPSEKAAANIPQPSEKVAFTTPTYAPESSAAPTGGEIERSPLASPLADTQSDKPILDLPTETSQAVPTISHSSPYNEKAREEAPAEMQNRSPPTLDTSSGMLYESSQSSNPTVTVQAPTPVVPQQEDVAESVISDRTPEQQARDTDIEMTDVGPSVPLSSNEVTGTSEDDTIPAPHRDASSHVNLPPPPPLEERQAQIAPAVPATTSPDTSLISSTAEAHKWLLPPARPEHRGRKCLVLDLDETLVHSSFKVGLRHRLMPLSHTILTME